MDLVRMGKEKRTLPLVKSQKGQTVVEYLLLIAVMVFITMMIMTSPVFKSWMGKDSVLFTELRRQMVYAYCNPMPAKSDSQESCEHDYGTILESYKAEPGDAGGTRFFIPADEYP